MKMYYSYNFKIEINFLKRDKKISKIGECLCEYSSYVKNVKVKFSENLVISKLLIG